MCGSQLQLTTGQYSTEKGQCTVMALQCNDIFTECTLTLLSHVW